MPCPPSALHRPDHPRGPVRASPGPAALAFNVVIDPPTAAGGAPVVLPLRGLPADGPYYAVRCPECGAELPFAAADDGDDGRVEFVGAGHLVVPCPYCGHVVQAGVRAVHVVFGPAPHTPVSPAEPRRPDAASSVGHATDLLQAAVEAARHAGPGAAGVRSRHR